MEKDKFLEDCVITEQDSLREEWEALLAKTEQLYIYGAGKIGGQILKLLELSGQEEKLLAFIVSEKGNSQKCLSGFPVMPIEELADKTVPIFVAVSDRYQEEILSLLANRGFINVVNVYKYACLAEDIPGKVEVVPLLEFLQKQVRDSYINRLDIMVRLVAIEDYYRNRPDAFRLYMWMQEYRNGKGYGDTARKRFERLLSSYDACGWDLNTEIQVDKDYQLLDGAHRVALALYHDRMFIKVRKLEKKSECEYGKTWFENFFPDGTSVKLGNRYKLEIARLEKQLYNTDRLKERLCLMLGKRPSFGRGNFYQSLPRLGITGQRPTDIRIKEYGLENLVAGKSVLDIGCNCGFLDLVISDFASSVDGVEYDSSLVQIAECTKEFLGKKNVNFEQGDFNTYTSKRKYDVIFSFAVHYWIGMPEKQYAEKLKSMLNENGVIVFESQDIEKDPGFDSYIEAFLSQGLSVVNEGTIRDDGIITRRWVVLRIWKN